MLKHFIEVPGLLYVDDVIDHKTHEKLCDIYQQSADFWSPVGSSINSRKVIHYGYAYDYTNKKPGVAMDQIPDFLEPLLSISKKYIPGTNFDSCIVNRYEPGQGIADHIDHLSFGPVIACFTLGGSVTINFKRGSTEQTLTVEPRSLYIMTKDARYKWSHGIAARKTDEGVHRQPRISITFRSITTP